MATESDHFSADLPEPGWMERLAAIHRAIHAVLATRTEIFREELAEKGSLFGKGLAGIAFALAFAGLSLLVLTALVAALLARLFGGPIAGIAVTLVLYLLITASAALFGMKKLERVKPLDFPATRDELRKDFDALRKEPPGSDEGAASSEALGAEKASIRPGEAGGGDRAIAEDLEDRFRAGSE